MYGHGQKHVWLNGRKACSEVTRISWILAESRGEPDFDTSPVFGRNVGIELDIEPSLECSARERMAHFTEIAGNHHSKPDTCARLYI